MVSYNKLFYVFLFILVITSIKFAFAVPTVSYNLDISFENKSYYSYPDTIKSRNVIMQVVTLGTGDICKYSKNSGINFESMEYSFDYNFQNVHRVDFVNLDNGIYRYYIRCRSISGNTSNELDLSFSVSSPVTAKVTLSGNNSYINEGIVKVNLVTSNVLSAKPTLSYSLNGVNYDPIPLTGSDTSWYGYIVLPGDIGEAAGSFRFRGIDMDGDIGEEITSGEIFLVDTIRPKGISDIRVIGQSNAIRIEWHFDESISEYRVYRNVLPNIDYSDYYKDTDEDYFIDKDVEKGKTYYYKISAVDKAGNEGPLSFEFSANSLKSNSTSSISNNLNTDSGLADELLSEVDGFLEDIDLLNDNIDQIRDRFTSNSEQKNIYSYLKLDRELDSSKNELKSLTNEVESYKSQSLTRSELDKKISNSKLKLNVIKKKIPESISLIESSKIERKITENEIREVLLSLYPTEVETSNINKRIRNSIDLINKNTVNNYLDFYILNLNYLDGSNNELTLVIENIESKLTSDANASIIEFIPKDIAESFSEIDMKNTIYDVLKDDPIISFPIDTKQIYYVINKKLDKSILSKIKTIVLVDEEIIISRTPTGFFSFADLENNGSYLGIIVFLLIAAGIIFYFISSKKKNKNLILIDEISNLILESKIYKKNNQNKELIENYNRISSIYKELGSFEKENIYPTIQKVFGEIKDK